MYLQIIVLFIIIIITKCSIVIDEFSQRGVNLSDYCPEVGVCKEGSHVMCTHYDPNNQMGPSCSGVQNALMTEENAALLLDLVNTIRSRAARGLAMGYEGELLPRAYGMFRVQWDPELATFAQVWANQCLIKFDECRATKKFPDPGQLAAVTRFVSDQWMPLSKVRQKDFVSTAGFSKKKIIYALKSNMRSWYKTSGQIDSEMITDRNTSWTEELLRNPYLQLVDGSVTHMGCGTSAFKEYFYETETTYLIYNVIRLICNFSSRVRDRRGIYTTDPPTQVNYTTECGCPPGYDEDSGCLCYESSKNQTKPCKKPKTPGKLQVVVLPIFTVEDYPRANEDSMINHKKHQALNKNEQQSRAIANRRYMPNGPPGKSLSTTPVIKLTSRKIKGDIQLNKIKKDVAPRKDFSKSKNLLSNYLNKRRTFNIQNKALTRQDNSFRRSLPIKSNKPPTDYYIRGNTYRNWEDGKYDLTQRKNTSFNIKPSYDENTQLLSLLNNLENEANKINVSKKDRNVLHNGIRKIFTALKKSRLINNKKDIIFNKKITEKKPAYVPFIENNKLRTYEDIFKNISLRNKPRNLSKTPSKFRNNINLISSLTGQKLETGKNSCKNHPTGHMYLTRQKLRHYLKSDDEYLPDSRKIYYSKRINDIRRKLKENYMKHMKSGRGLQIRPTFGASHLQFRQTLPNIEG